MAISARTPHRSTPDASVTPTSDPGVLGLATMTASGCLPCELAAAQGAGQFRPEEMAARAAYAAATPLAADAPAPTPAPTAARWAGVIGMEGTMTGDGRLIEPNALRWDAAPLPLRVVRQDVGAHDGAEVAGRILSVERRAGGAIWAEGDFDMGSEPGREAHRLVSLGYMTGVSMDLDDVSFEVRIASDLLEGDDLLGGFPLLAADADTDAEAPETDDEGRVTVATIGADDEVRVTTDARVRAATLVAIPAFAQAQIALVAGGEDDPPPPALPDADAPDEEDAGLAAEMEALTASAIPVTPPAAWFEAPALAEPTAFTVTAEGRVYGHLALWGTCHTTHAQRGQCIAPPHSSSGYAGFHLGSLVTAEGREVAVGRITMDTRHAADHLTAASATMHYDNTGAVAADVRAGEDQHGIWVAGALRPGTTPEQVRALRAAPLSGDWRARGTGLELVAVLAVNVPGFPVPRPQGLVASGRLMSLVASGMVPPARVRRPGHPGALSVDDLRYLKRLAARERRAEADALASRVAATRAAADERRVRAFAASLAASRSDGPTSTGESAS